MPASDRHILLLETPFLSQTGTEEVRAYVQSKYNLALLALGSFLRSQSDLRVFFLNMVKERMGAEELVRRLRPSPPSVIGISLYSYSLSITYAIIRRLKIAFPETHICVGGPHVNIFPRETLQLEGIDSIVLGDGETPFLEICRQVVGGRTLDPRDLPQGVYTHENVFDETPFLSHKVRDLDALPTPDLSLLGDHRRYRDFLSNRVMGLLSSSRGCPFVCHYCRSQQSQYRPFSVDHTVDSLKRYRSKGVEYVEFWDETFNPSRKRLEKFAEALGAADLGLSWAIRGAVVNHVPKDVLRELKRLGLKLIQFGVETGTPRLFHYLNKKIDRESVIRAFETCRAIGLRTAANMMINIPGQTEREMHDDLSFLESLRPTYVSVSIYNWAPGTTHYERALEAGTLQTDHWRLHAADPSGPEPIVHPVNSTPVEEVYRLRSRYVMRHYFDPFFLYRYWRMIDARELSSAARIAFLMLRSGVRSALRPSRTLRLCEGGSEGG